jgi:serine/threonine protein phosphatase PrpC
MSPEKEAASTGAGHPEFDRLLGESRAWLSERGEMIVGSGGFRKGRLSASIHSDFGPAGQDKTTNQDYALAWWPSAVEARRPSFVLAVSDGLTTSFRSELASALACWVGARALVENVGMFHPKELARLAFNEAGRAIGRLADALARDPEASCPEDQFLSTWKYILKKGGLLQTTLTLAWLDGDDFCIAMVGDGGALWREYGNVGQVGNLSHARRTKDRVLAACNLDSHQVFALGPLDRAVRDFDCWQVEKVSGPFLCAISTDGIGRGLGVSPLILLDELESLHGAGKEDTARRFIEQAIRQRPKDFDDNLTLAVIRVE